MIINCIIKPKLMVKGLGGGVIGISLERYLGVS